MTAHLEHNSSTTRARLEIPLYRSREWYALPADDPRRLASMRRAADAWARDGEPETIAARLREEFAVADLLCRWRVRCAGLDIHGVVGDWVRVLDVVRARANGYRPLERTPRLWSAEDLDRATWREVSS